MSELIQNISPDAWLSFIGSVITIFLSTTFASWTSYKISKNQ